MRLPTLPLLSLIALPMIANALPTNQGTATQQADDLAGMFASGFGFTFLYVNGGCSPNFGGPVGNVRVFDGYRCRFFREDNCKGRIGGVEGLPSPGGDLYQPARSATCWHG